MPSKLHFSIELLESDAVIIKKILQGLAEEFNNRVQSKIQSIANQVRTIIIPFLQQTDTYFSLVSGELAAQFGLPTTTRKTMVDAIIQKISDNIEVEYKPVRVIAGKFSGGLEFRILVANFSDILNMTEAFVTIEDGSSLPWLEWLLIKGNRLIIAEHKIHLIGGKGRSGMAIMVKNNASSWRVPSTYSGVMGDNWLTRALTINQDQFMDQIKTILENELQ
jgi:hypothetical protein